MLAIIHSIARTPVLRAALDLAAALGRLGPGADRRGRLAVVRPHERPARPRPRRPVPVPADRLADADRRPGCRPVRPTPDRHDLPGDRGVVCRRIGVRHGGWLAQRDGDLHRRRRPRLRPGVREPDDVGADARPGAPPRPAPRDGLVHDSQPVRADLRAGPRRPPLPARPDRGVRRRRCPLPPGRPLDDPAEGPAQRQRPPADNPGVDLCRAGVHLADAGDPRVDLTRSVRRPAWRRDGAPADLRPRHPPDRPRGARPAPLSTGGRRSDDVAGDDGLPDSKTGSGRCCSAP